MNLLLPLAAALMISPAGGSRAVANEIRAILARHLEARGGATAWRAARSLRLHGAMSVNGRENRCTLLRKGTVRTRLTCTYRELEEVYLVNEDGSWLKGYRAAAFEPVTEVASSRPEDLFHVRVKLELFASEAPDPENPPRATLARADDLGSGGTRRLVLGSEEGSTEDWSFDATTGLLVKKLKPVPSGAGSAPSYEVYHFDYRASSGLWFPFYSEADFGTALFSLSLDTVEVNPEIQDFHFLSPAAPADD